MKFLNRYLYPDAGQYLAGSLGVDPTLGGAPPSVSASPPPASTGGSLLGAVASAVPVVGGVISTLINNAAVDKANAANREFSLEQQDKQNAYNLQMWHLQTDYNSPAAMMLRYKAAGLNPNLIYGSATGNVAAPVTPSAKADYVQVPHPSVDFARTGSSAIEAYNSTMLGNAQMNNLQTQSTLNVANQALTLAKEITETYNPAKVASETVKNATESQVAGSLLPYQIRQAMADTQYTLTKNDLDVASTAMSLSEAVSRIAKNKADTALSTADADRVRANTSQILNDTKFQQMDLALRNEGVMPHDGLFQRVLGNLIGLIDGGNIASGSRPLNK